ncbi:MAG: hypothetical protein AAB415_00405 [Patescibacteria group bacterium]
MKNDLNDMARRIEKLETAVFESGKSKSRKSKVSGKDRGNSLPDRILTLRDTGFLKQPKTAPEVQTKLQSVYACEVDKSSWHFSVCSKGNFYGLPRKVPVIRS